MKATRIVCLLALLLSPWCSAATLAKYLVGTNSFTASDVSSAVTATTMTTTGTSEWRTSYGSPGNTPAGPNLGTSSGSYWRLFKAGFTPATAASGSASVIATLNATGANFTPTLLTFDLANAIHASVVSSVTTTFSIFINDVELNPSLITPSSSLTKTGSSSYMVQTFAADLSGLGELSSLKIEIALADDVTPDITVGNFIQGIHIEGVIPEPGQTALLLLSALAFALRRNRQ